MFGKAQPLVEKYPVLFYFRIANKFYSPRHNISCTQQGRIGQVKKKKRLVLLCITFCIVLQFFLTQNERKVKVFQSHCVETNLIPKLMLRADLINYFLDFQT